ncbi:phosphoinositide phosphatase sac9-related [Anaeramoeba ignava]|uniref:Phosphoinositide phosphatase sac9-related n=1 Tax=Anaeramoeba ignava TaxID=1746090 RepID=A0A9Q0LAE1_ANAIG|nr:phosphoinositide phosphatase sac9-related [Anaeramoeba ignava]
MQYQNNNNNTNNNKNTWKTKRKTTHLIIQTTNNQFFIISSLSTRNDTQLFSIDPISGNLKFVGRENMDIFSSEEEAQNYLTFTNKLTIKQSTRAEALLGYVVIGSFGLILIATKVQLSAQLYGEHKIYTLISTNWIKVKLSYLQFDNQNVQKKIDKMMEFILDRVHFYSETYDITHPFPSSYDIDDYDPIFCWNMQFRKTFEELGLSRWCVVLLQGVAVGSFIPCFRNGILSKHSQEEINLVYFAKKTNLNPGTRYYARGLNDIGESGNEMECEIICFLNSIKVIKWFSYIYRTGTVPLRWKTSLKTKISKPKFVIKKNPFNKSELYFQRIMKRLETKNITCVNLLKSRPNNNENELNKYFQNIVEYVKDKIKINLSVINFDWSFQIKTQGKAIGIKRFWESIKKTIIDYDLNSGQIELVGKDDVDFDLVWKEILNGDGESIQFDFENQNLSNIEINSVFCPDGNYAITTLASKQKGVLRVNCADSLDRTNVATFFASIQILAEMCRRLGVGLTTKFEFEKWKALDLDLLDIKNHISSAILETLAQFFVRKGDVCSFLYTYSKAMQTSLIREFSPNISNAPNDSFIVLMRRYQNVAHDPTRQIQYELFLGLKKLEYFPHFSHFPNSFNRNILISSYPTWFLSHFDYEKIYPDQNGPLEQIIHDSSSVCYCDPHSQSINLQICLRKPSFITEICITIRNEIHSHPPSYMDIDVGNYINKMKNICRRQPIPKCKNGTKLYYKINLLNIQNENNKNNQNNNNEAFHQSFNLVDSNPKFKRLIFIKFFDTFQPNQKSKLAIGKIDVFGEIFEFQSPKKAQEILHDLYMNNYIERIHELIPPSNYFHDFLLFDKNRHSDSIKTLLINTFDNHKTSEKVLLNIEHIHNQAHTFEKKMDNEKESKIDNSLFEFDNENDYKFQNDILKEKNFDILFDEIEPESLDTNVSTSKQINEENENQFNFGDNLDNNNNNHHDLILNYLDSHSKKLISEEIIPIKKEEEENQENQFEQFLAKSSQENFLIQTKIYQQFVTNILQKFGNKNKIQLSFLNCLKLEVIRLAFQITVLQRNRLIKAIHPFSELEMKQFDIENYLNRKSYDDIYLQNEEQSNEYSNLFEKEKCSNTKCKNQKPTSIFQCKYCSKFYCNKCISKVKEHIIEYDPNRLFQVCKKCRGILTEINYYHSQFQKIKSQKNNHVKKRRNLMQFLASTTDKVDIPVWKGISQNSIRNLQKEFYKKKENIYNIYEKNNVEIISRYPRAFILTHVQTDENSLPIQSILFDLCGVENEYWFSSIGERKIEIMIGFECKSIIDTLYLDVDPLGYNSFDIPSISISCGSKFQDLFQIDKWNLESYLGNNEK